MTLHLYTTLKTWRRARQYHKDAGAGPLAAKPADRAARAETANAVVYAAGIACAGQVPEQPTR